MANDTPIFFWKEDDPEFGFLCQWYPARFDSNIINDGKQIKFRNAEQYMMYRKAALFNDHSIAREIIFTSDPRKCKALGRSIKGFTDTEWDKVKSQIVEEGSYYKFTRSQGKAGEDLKKKVIGYGKQGVGGGQSI